MKRDPIMDARMATQGAGVPFGGARAIRPGPANLLAVARRALTPSEHEEQAAVIAWAALHEEKWPCLSLLYAVPNGGHRHAATAGRLRAEGVRAGVPDLVLPSARGGYCGLYLEMKRAPAGGGSLAAVTDDQRAWLVALAAEGYATAVCLGAEAAIRVLAHYCGMPPTVAHLSAAGGAPLAWPHTPVFPALRATRTTDRTPPARSPKSPATRKV